MKNYISKNVLNTLLSKYSENLEKLIGLEDANSIRSRFEYEIIITLLEKQLVLTKEEKKKEYLQLYYCKNKDKLNKRYKERAKIIRDKSRKYDKLKLLEKNNLK